MRARVIFLCLSLSPSSLYLDQDIVLLIEVGELALEGADAIAEGLHPLALAVQRRHGILVLSSAHVVSLVNGCEFGTGELRGGGDWLNPSHAWLRLA